MDAPYQQLAAKLRELIADGTWPPGTRIPSVRNLEARYRVGKGVASRAVHLLHVEGLFEGKPRARLHVAPPYTAPRTLINPDAEWPYLRGSKKPEEGRVRAGPILSVRLRVPPRSLLYMERIDLLDPDSRAAMLVTTWRRSPVDLPHSTFRCHVAHHLMTRQEAALLGVATGTAALLVERTRYDGRGRPVQAADLVLPVDRWRLGY